MDELRQRVVVVTGAASGIGRALAIRLAKAGADLALIDRDLDRLHPVQEELRPHRVTVHALDVADASAWPAVVAAILDEHGRVDVLINNAGVALTARFDATTLADAEWQMAVNYWGVHYGCHFFLPHLRKRPEALIVNLSSLFGLVGAPDNSVYCASKFAVRGLSETLRAELVGTPVQVLVVHPGAVATGIVTGGKHVASEGGVTFEAARKLIARGMPPEQAADRIVLAIRRGEKRLVLGRDARLGDLLQRLLPVHYQTLAQLLLARLPRHRAKSGTTR